MLLHDIVQKEGCQKLNTELLRYVWARARARAVGRWKMETMEGEKITRNDGSAKHDIRSASVIQSASESTDIGDDSAANDQNGLVP